ncbi:hypothetical protein BC835DRAFT_1272629 [Cytidiella melzeri]|nr:hypothetical protein BC835DRAFT_1272629 [Cytidiella melzeri]
MGPPPPTPPPTDFTIYPHHLQLLKILMTIFYTYQTANLPADFLIKINRLLLEEVSETRTPPTLQELKERVEALNKGKSAVVASAIQEMWTLVVFLSNTEKIMNFFQGKSRRYLVALRRSMFGYFVRRCYITFMKLSFESKYALMFDYRKWYISYLVSGAIHIKKDILSMDHSVYKTPTDKRESVQTDEYRMWEKSLALGDDLTASESLRRFFEQRFHDGNDSGLRQHTLLNLARLHYSRHEHVACRKLLEEAITVARTCNDRQTLQYCISMLNRLQPLERNRKMVINELQPDLPPYEALFDVKKLLMVGNQQPLSAAFERIAQAASLYDLWAESRRDQVTPQEQWGTHVVQSIVWSMMGNTQMAELEEDMVLGFTHIRGNDNNRLTVYLNRAYRYARQGDYEKGVSLLLNPDVWCGIDMADYEQWAAQIWHVLMLRASRRGQTRMISDYLWPKRFIHGATLKEYTYGPSAPLNSMIRDPLHEVLTLREAGQGHTVIQPLLTSIWHSEFQQRYACYRPGIILLADVALEFGMSRWCRRIMEELMPQVIAGDDLEQRAFACFTLARCIIAAGDSTQEALKESIHYLKIAEADYAKMDLFRSLQDTQYYLSVVYHNLDMTNERDEAARRHEETKERAEDAKKVVIEEWITDVMDLITEVGVALTTRPARWHMTPPPLPPHIKKKTYWEDTVEVKDSASR